MLVESLGKVEPLSVHKMDPSRVLPEFDPDAILNLVQKVSNRVEYPRFARLSRLTIFGLQHVLSLPSNAYARKPKKQVRFKDAVDALVRWVQVAVGRK